MFFKILTILSNMFIIVFLLIIITTAFVTILKNKNQNCSKCKLKNKCKGKNLQNNFKILGYTNKESKKGGKIKMNEVNKNKSSNDHEVNKSIACTVTDCKNHCKHKDYCSLDRIEIEAHKANPKACDIDCTSFEKKCNN